MEISALADEEREATWHSVPLRGCGSRACSSAHLVLRPAALCTPSPCLFKFLLSRHRPAFIHLPCSGHTSSVECFFTLTLLVFPLRSPVHDELPAWATVAQTVEPQGMSRAPPSASCPGSWAERGVALPYGNPVRERSSHCHHLPTAGAGGG